MALSENYESYCYYVLTHYNHYAKLEKKKEIFIILFSGQKYKNKIKCLLFNLCILKQETVIFMPPY